MTTRDGKALDEFTHLANEFEGGLSIKVDGHVGRVAFVHANCVEPRIGECMQGGGGEETRSVSSWIDCFAPEEGEDRQSRLIPSGWPN